MKKQFLYISILTALLVSCGDDFTNLSPVSERNNQNFYRNATDFTVAINGAYDALQSNGTYGRNYILLNEMRSDNVANDAGASGLSITLEQIDKFSEFPDNDYLQNTWAASYAGIARTNAILDRIDAATFNETQRNQFKGEALFIRSLLYYNLAVVFGNIPLVLNEISSPEGIEVVQVPASGIYAQIAQDPEHA